MRSLHVALVLIVVFLVGCADTADQKQIAWHDRLEATVRKSNDALGSRRFVSFQTLLQTCGPVDVDTTVQSLGEMMRESASNESKLVEANLYFGWCLSQNLHADEEHPFETNQSFLGTRACIYDERRHFKAPLPDSAGFDSYVFLISGEDVVAASVIIPSPVWKGGE